MARARLHATVSGRVQGVGFRHFVTQEAERLGLAGWVRNTYGGDVEVLAEGERDSLEQLLASLRRGPRPARVDGIQADWTDHRGEFDRFRVTG